MHKHADRWATPQPLPEQRAQWQWSQTPVSRGANTGNSAETALETAGQAKGAQIREQVFPVSSPDVQHVPARVSIDRSPVSVEIREAIRRMKEAKMPDRDIAALLGLSGRKYVLYRQALQQMGYYAKEAEG